MTPLAVGPILALIGIVAAFFVLRGKAKSRKSMYRTLRERREVDLRKARERATAAKGATERAAIERETAAQAAAAAAAPAAGPASAATIQPPASDAPPSNEPPLPGVAPPGFAPPPPGFAPPPPGFAPPPGPPPAYTPQEPTYTPPEPPPGPPPPPFEQAPAEVLPEPPPTAGDQTRPAWEIVQPDKQAAEDVAAAGVGAGSSSQASWELDPREQQRVDEFYKKHGRHEEVDEEDPEGGQETIGQVLLSYAGLIIALLVIFLGILFMIGGRAP
jgi:hypothetical protein